MQILRQALFYKLSTNIILFKVLRNKILCLTEFQLVLLSIDEGCKKVQIPYSGTNVWTIQMSKDCIAILLRSGSLQIRKLDNIKQVIFSQNNIKIANLKYPKLKWWEDNLHIIYQKKYDQISVSNLQLSTHALPFEVNLSQSLVHLEFCDLFAGLKSIFYVMSNSINMVLNGFNLGALDLSNEEIKQVLRLCHPFQANEFKKQYLAVLTESRNGSSETKRSFLKVYNILNMSLIFCKELYKQKNQQIEIICDELCEYLLVKYSKRKTPNSITIQTQNLMKINADYYYSHNSSYFENYEPFFFFEILIGLKKDLKLFPSHSEKIKGRLCNSIDTCYFDENQIFIASIVLEASYKDQIFKTFKQIEAISSSESRQHNQTDILVWSQIVEARINPQSLIDKIFQSICLRNSSKPEMETSFSLDISIEQERIIQDLLSSLSKINHFNLNDLNKAYLTIKKIITIEYFPMLMDMASIQKDVNKTTREILQKNNEDSVNTMSGFSSSQPHSPRSIHSSQTHKSQQKKSLFKEIGNDVSKAETIYRKENQIFCRQCCELEDHENLELISFIEEGSSKKAQNTLTKIQEQIYKMETLCKYRLEKMEMKTRKDKTTQKNVISLIQNEFRASLSAIQLNLISSVHKFTEKLTRQTQIPTEQSNQANHYLQNLQDTHLNYENEFKIHKDSKEELLDYLYDIEFPDLGMETYQPASFISPFNQSHTKNSITKSVNRTISDMTISKPQSQDFKLFSDFILKNFI